MRDAWMSLIPSEASKVATSLKQRMGGNPRSQSFTDKESSICGNRNTPQRTRTLVKPPGPRFLWNSKKIQITPVQNSHVTTGTSPHSTMQSQTYIYYYMPYLTVLIQTASTCDVANKYTSEWRFLDGDPRMDTFGSVLMFWSTKIFKFSADHLAFLHLVEVAFSA